MLLLSPFVHESQAQVHPGLEAQVVFFAPFIFE
jgi:hypothetical protein